MGSASIDLLAGRIEFVRLNPINLMEIEHDPPPLLSLWVRGGLSDSLLAATDTDSSAFSRPTCTGTGSEAV